MIGVHLRRHPGFEPSKRGENAQSERRRQEGREIEANPEQDANRGGEPNGGRRR
jgi:hypothetical protein